MQGNTEKQYDRYRIQPWLKAKLQLNKVVGNFYLWVENCWLCSDMAYVNQAIDIHILHIFINFVA